MTEMVIDACCKAISSLLRFFHPYSIATPNYLSISIFKQEQYLIFKQEQHLIFKQEQNLIFKQEQHLISKQEQYLIFKNTKTL